MGIIRKSEVNKIVLTESQNKELIELLSTVESVKIKRVRGKAYVYQEVKEEKPVGVIIKKKASKHNKRKNMIKDKAKRDAEILNNERVQSSAVIAKSYCRNSY